MIFTTVIVSCLFALMGVFHSHASVDTLISAFTRPTLSPLTAFLQVIGSTKRYTLDITPLAEEATTFNNQLPPLDGFADVFANFHHNPHASLNFTPIPNTLIAQSQCALQGPLHLTLLRISLNIFLCIIIVVVSCAFYSYVVDTCSTVPNTVETQDDHVLPLDSHLPTSASTHHDTHILEQDDDTHGTPEDVHYDPLVFIRSPTSITKMNILRSPPPAFVSPTLSSSSSCLADTEETAESSTLFGVPHYRRTTLTYTSPDEEEEMADYLRFSLNIPRDGAPPVEGWWSGEGSPAWRPSTRELDSWAFPYLDLDDSDPFLDRNPAPGPLPPFILHTIDMSSLFASDEDVEDSDGEEENLKDLSTLGIPPRSPVQSIDSDDDEDNDHSLRFPVDDRSDLCVNALIPFSSPHLSTSSVEDADDEPTHAFGVSLHDRLPEWHMDPEEDELREYLRFALGVGWQRDNAPPIEGWWSPANSEEDEEYDDANYAWYPFCMDMDSWNFPRPADMDDPFLDPVPVGAG